MMLPVRMQGASSLLDVIQPTFDDELARACISASLMKGLLECFLLVWGQASMMNGNVQRDVGARMWTQTREGVGQGHFLTGAVMENVVIALEVQ